MYDAYGSKGGARGIPQVCSEYEGRLKPGCAEDVAHDHVGNDTDRKGGGEDGADIPILGN